MQVDVHRIDAEIARAHAADDGVEVRAVAIEVAAGRMDQVGDLLDVGSNRPHVFGLVSMMPAMSIVCDQLGLQVLHVDAAIARRP